VNIFQRCIDSGQEQYFEAGIFDGSGRKRLIRWKCGIMNLETGKLVLYCGEDITEQEAEHIQLMKSLHNLNKVTEELERRVRERTYDLETININLELQIEERKEIEKQLLNSERLHMAMAHNFPNGIIAVLDEHLRFVLVDGQDLETLGYSSELLLGKYIFSKEFGLDVEAVDSLQRAFKGDTSLFEVILQGVYYSLTAVPLPDYENQIGKILVVFQNISQHKKLEQSLYSSIDQERKLNELKSRFVTMASHEFRTPLSTILSSAFLLESYSGQMYEQKKYHHINLIKRTVNSLTESLNDFLRLGKLEEGRVKLVLSETPVEEYVSDIVKEMQTIMKPGQEIRYEHHGIQLHVLLDRNLLRGILLNLLSNAGKYSPENTSVSLKTLLQEEQLMIQVSDKGLGIPAEERQHIFDRFFRAVNALHIEGTGLGLHIVKKYVELMNGRIDFQSGDEGTTFTVEIPLHSTQDGNLFL
jgi:signal transduction histidine kinase